MRRVMLATLVITFVTVLTVGPRSTDNANADATGVAVTPSPVFVQPGERARPSGSWSGSSAA